MRDNQSDNNILNDEKRIVLGEINSWLRNINNTVWIVTSFFITLNFLIIRSTFYKPVSCFIKNSCFLQNLLLISLVLFLLWIVPVLFILSMIIISEELYNLIKSDSLEIKKFAEVSKFDLRKDIKIKKVYRAIKLPWGWILIALTAFFFVSWVWILATFN